MTTGWTHEEGVPYPMEPGEPWPGWADAGRWLRRAWPSALRSGLLWPAAAALLALTMAAAALTFGRYPLTLQQVLAYPAHLLGLVVLDPAQVALLQRLLVEIRLPRVLAALLTGAALASSGAAFQAVFRNPLVSPDLLGVMAGASAGAAGAMLLDLPWITVQALAFAGGVLAVALGVAIAQIFGGGALVMLVLGGIVSGALFTSLLSLVKVLADPYNQLPAIVVWLMGNLGQAGSAQLAWLALPMGLAVAALCMLGPWLDALAMGDDEARTLGVPVGPLRLGVIALATLLSALTVSLAGMIGWVGLIVPHAARLLTGPRNALLLPTSAFLGAAFLVGADMLARNAFAAEIPIGILTQLLGIPLFLLVLARVRRGWAA
ncbi:FecCD family ABC transporter permease [Variovorax ginsengisoli]|uniref:Iron complex transport system permease protein n=1 Tax=Variovorax ginsengisoli TaxID=363844 RepID=A0ABT9SED2_9BURK|nr:iron ABC transporter permease [Variovorax ginsengisoli]MDP9902723.1 iron complex transport system permease protein [Variovorax ginsengisoli]